MYAARFELETGTWSVCAGRVKPGTSSHLPRPVAAALASGRLRQLAVRYRFDTDGVRVELLVPWDDAESLPALQAELALVPGIDWCRSAAEFDAMTDDLGPHQRWLDTSEFSVNGLRCPVEASWIPDAALFRRLAGQAHFTHQINIAHRPPVGEEQRLLRKHLARLDVLADDDDWPAGKLEAQRRLIERRLESPWLVDELIACDSESDCERLSAGLHDRLVVQGGAALAMSAAQSGRFDELAITGLDSSHFVTHDAVAVAGRSIAAATLWALLEPRDGSSPADVKVHDAFLSHAFADAATAQRLCALLEAGGMRCWIAPRDIAAGRHYAEVIDDALRQSRGIVLLMSPAGMASEHVLRELERAVHYRLRVLPVRLAPLEPLGAFSYLLSGCQWTDALPGSDEQGWSRRVLDGLVRELPAP
ncbi:MAG TPA: toll/interleukin-1 receptor domain-containing protein [Caldimonas sp.]|nr:toll/interleukin-1 receptor domain-containing protein [Caldimonas sp.]